MVCSRRSICNKKTGNTFNNPQAIRVNTSTNDVTILGGGLAGLSLALQCRQQIPQARITVLEKHRHPVPEAAFKVGESTVEVAANYFANVLGLKQHIVDQQLPKLGLRFFFPAGDNSSIENRLELGGRRYAPASSYQLDRGRFENHLAECCREAGIQLVSGARIQDFQLARRGPHQVSYDLDGQRQVVNTRWIADASGRRAFVKRKLGLQKPSPHIGNAAWFRFGKHIKIDDWSNDPAWRDGHSGATGRWYSTNHLMGRGYWVWLIPLASGSTSMGIVASEQVHPLSSFNSFDKALAWLDRHEPQCAQKVREHVDQLQDFRAIKHYSVECTRVFSARRWGITGEAGFFHDPFYSPGSDFIAFANTLLSDLIRRDLTGRDYRIRARTYDRIYKRFYYGTSTAYLDQYQLFGNPQVMPVKILWDYLIYWSITGFIFMHDRVCQQTMYMQHVFRLGRLGKLNHVMQGFFRQWHQQTADAEVNGTIDISSMALIRETNQRLLDELDSRSFNRQFADNVGQIETLFWEIVDHAGLDVDIPVKRRRYPRARTDAFRHVFEQTAVRKSTTAVSPERIAAGA